MKVYAGYSANENIRQSNSSGAVFSLLAEYIFSKQGVIYGVVMSNDDYSVEFKKAEDEM